MAEHRNKPPTKGGADKRSGGGVWGFVSDVLKGVSANITVGAPPRARTSRDPTDPAERMEPVHEDRREAYEETIYRKTEGENGTAPAVRVDRDRKIIARSLEGRTGGGGAPAAVPSGGGAPLAGEVRRKMEPRLGSDLSDVRVHTSGDSDQAAQGLGARAFTVGKDVHFGAGNYQPGTKEGDRLLAHELTHVVQGQNGGGVQRKAEHGDEHEHEGGEHGVSDPGEPAEKEADAVADHVAEDLHGDAAGGAHKDAKGKDAKGKDAKGDAHGGADDKKHGDHDAAGGEAKAAPNAREAGGAPSPSGGAASAAATGGAAPATAAGGAHAAPGGGTEAAGAGAGAAKPKESAPAVGRKIMRSAQAAAITASAPGTKIFRVPATPPAAPTAAKPPTAATSSPGGTPPSGGAPQQPPPKKVATTLAIAPTTLPTLKWELTDDLRDAQSGVIHAGAPAAADPGTEQILAQFPGKASFDEASKKLTLPAPNAAALANTTSKSDLGAQVAAQTGVGTVTLTKNGNNLSLSLSMGIAAPNAISGVIETPPPPYAPKATDVKAKELRQLTFGNQWFTLEILKAKLKEGTDGVTNKTVDQWVKTWKDAGDLVARPGVDGDWTFDKSLVEKQEKDNLLAAAKTRAGELKTAWERGVNKCTLAFRTADDKLTMLWGPGPNADPANPALPGASYACTVDDGALAAGADAAWEHRTELENVDGGVKKPITQPRALMALQRETSPNAKSAFQQRVGAAAADDCKTKSLARVPAGKANEKLRDRLDNIHYDLGSEVEGNTGRTGRIVMPDSSVNHPQIPEKLRRAIADKISGKGVRVTRGDGAHIAVKVELEMKPGEWVSIKEATGPLFAAARAEAAAADDFDPALLASIDRWVSTDLLSQDEDHHCVPKWLGGPVNPPLYVVLPRVLHNFDDPGTPMDKKPRLGFHQVLNGLLRGAPLLFGTPGRPSINANPDAEDKSVMDWAERDDPNLSSAQKKAALRAAITTAFDTVLKNAEKALVDEIKKVIEKDFPK